MRKVQLRSYIPQEEAIQGRLSELVSEVTQERLSEEFGAVTPERNSEVASADTVEYYRLLLERLELWDEALEEIKDCTGISEISP